MAGGASDRAPDLGALHKGEAALLAGHDGDGPAHLAQGLPRVVLDQAPDQQRLPHLHPAQSSDVLRLQHVDVSEWRQGRVADKQTVSEILP